MLSDDDEVGAPVAPKPLSQISPVAISSTADWAELPAWPENVKVPKSSFPTVILWASNGLFVPEPASLSNSTV